jgi:uncharacterized protein YndB with AHSA1/START domain
MRGYLPTRSKDDLMRRSMRNSGTWATKTEIFVAPLSYVKYENLNLHIVYGWQWRWVQHSPNQVETVGNIYITYHNNLTTMTTFLVLDERTRNVKRQN